MAEKIVVGLFEARGIAEDLRNRLVTDGTPPVEAIRSELTADGMPVTVINLHSSSRRHITSGFLTRTLPGGTKGGNFDGIVLPAATVPSLSGHEMSALASYDRRDGLRAGPSPNSSPGASLSE